jgi:hypothetical protein
MDKRLKVMILGLSSVTVLGTIGGLAWAQSPHTSSHPAIYLNTMKPSADKKSHYKRHHGIIAKVTAYSGNVLSVVHGKKNTPETVPLTNTTIRAGSYPASPTSLAVGERIRILGLHGAHPLILLSPIGRGILHNNNGQWTVVNKKTTWTLTNADAPILGMSNLTAGTTVTLYGTVAAGDVTATVITAEPKHVSATVITNTDGTVTLASHNLGSLSYQLPTNRSAKWLHVGRTVIAVINPESHTVLQLMPKQIKSWHKTARIAQHNLVGQMVRVNGSTLDLTTSWGTETLTLGSRMVKVIYPGHPQATLSQIPAGSSLLIHITPKKILIRVLIHASVSG